MLDAKQRCLKKFIVNNEPFAKYISDGGYRTNLPVNFKIGKESICRFHWRVDKVCASINDNLLANCFGQIPKECKHIKINAKILRKNDTASLLENDYVEYNPFLTAEEMKMK